MNTNRITQLRALLWNNSTETNVLDVNQEVIEKISEKTLKQMILRYIDENNISSAKIAHIDNILYDIYGDIADRNMSIVQYFYKILTEKIILPNYDLDDQEKLYKEISEIIERVQKSVKIKMKNRNNSDFFNIGIPDLTRVRREFEIFGTLEERGFHLGGVFGYIEIYNDPDEALSIEIPVRIGNKWASRDGSDIISEKNFFKALNAAIPLLNEIKFTEWEITLKVLWLPVDFQLEKTKDQFNRFGKDIHDEYLLMSIAVEPLHDRMTDEKITQQLWLVLGISEKIINNIAKVSEIKHKNRTITLTNDYLDLDSINSSFLDNKDSKQDDNNAEWYVEQNSSGLLNLTTKKLHTQDKISLDDIGGNNEAKKEVKKLLMPSSMMI